MMDDDTPASGLDVQDPLPETSWLWRRIYSFLFSLISVAFIWYGIEALNAMREPDAVYRLTRYMIGVHVLLVTYYMVAPSAEQITKMIQSVKLLRSGVPLVAKVIPSPAPPAIPAAPEPTPEGIPEEAPWHDPTGNR